MYEKISSIKIKENTFFCLRVNNLYTEDFFYWVWSNEYLDIIYTERLVSSDFHKYMCILTTKYRVLESTFYFIRTLFKCN